MPPSAKVRTPPPGFGKPPSGARRILPPPPTITAGATGPVRLRDFQGRFLGGGYGVQWHGLEASGAYLAGMAQEITGGATQALIEQLAEQAEDRMKLQAPWEDRTGEAREGLTAVVDSDADTYRIHLGHTAEHGIFLETMQGGRFQIIQPTIRWLAEILGPAVARDINSRK